MMRRYMIYSAVIVAMAASIAVAGFIGPLLIGIGLECAAKRLRPKFKS